jgi:hypothetical protein
MAAVCGSCGEGDAPAPSSAQIVLPSGVPLPGQGPSCVASQGFNRLQLAVGSRAEGFVSISAECKEATLLSPCHQWKMIPGVSLRSLEPAVLEATFDARRPASTSSIFSHQLPCVVHAKAAGLGRVQLDDSHGGRSTHEYEVVRPASWKLTWLLHDSWQRPLEAASLPGALVAGGGLRVVTRLNAASGAMLCGHPPVTVESAGGLLITMEPGYANDDPGALANGVLRATGQGDGRARLAVEGAATELQFVVLAPGAITELRAEPTTALDTNPLVAYRGFSFLGTRVRYQSGGSEGKPAAFVVRLRALAGDVEVGGVRLAVQNLTPQSARLVGSDGVASDLVETAEPIVGLVPLQSSAAQVSLRVSAVDATAAQPLEVTIEVPPAPMP